MTNADVSKRRPVLVGVDGSEHSLAAVDVAVEEAALRGLPLEILHAFVLPVMARPIGTVPDLPVAPVSDAGESALREHAEQVLATAADRARASHPDVPMISRLRDGFPGEVLSRASQQAALVVVGHRGMGGFAELLTGSVGLQLANHAAAPAIIVRGEVPGRAGPVVVGVDGSDASWQAAEFALETAARHQAAVIALHAWPVDAAWPPALVQAGHPPPQVPAEITETLAALANRHPEVEVHPEVREGVAAHEALIAASKNARLVVVGSRGRGGFRGLLLGSVSQALLHHADSPVAVVRHPSDPSDPSRPSG